jgi:hypothetical protein
MFIMETRLPAEASQRRPLSQIAVKKDATAQGLRHGNIAIDHRWAHNQKNDPVKGAQWSGAGGIRTAGTL